MFWVEEAGVCGVSMGFSILLSVHATWFILQMLVGQALGQLGSLCWEGIGTLLHVPNEHTEVGVTH